MVQCKGVCVIVDLNVGAAMQNLIHIDAVHHIDAFYNNVLLIHA